MPDEIVLTYGDYPYLARKAARKGEVEQCNKFISAADALSPVPADVAAFIQSWASREAEGKAPPKKES